MNKGATGEVRGKEGETKTRQGRQGTGKRGETITEEAKRKEGKGI